MSTRSWLSRLLVFLLLLLLVVLHMLLALVVHVSSAFVVLSVVHETPPRSSWLFRSKERGMETELPEFGSLRHV